MKTQLLLFFSLFCVFFNSCSNNNNYQSLINEGLIESVNINFASVNNSSYYIEKYKLNKDEVTNIGNWYINQFINNDYVENGGLGISVSFFPNRIFKAYRDNAKVNDIQYIFGQWKIDNSRLFIKLVTRAIVSTNNELVFSTLKNQEYYEIMKINKYKNAVINSTAYNFDNIPKEIIDYFSINKKELPRSRLLFDTLGDPPGDLTEGSRYEQLFNDESMSIESLQELIDVW